MKHLYLILLLGAAVSIKPAGMACTNILVTRGASADGSTFMFYSNDGEWLYHLNLHPAADHAPGDSLEFVNRFGARGKIHQAPHTYAVLGFHMNEHQLSIGETTFTGREELWNKALCLEYWHLMTLALERASNAREAIQVIAAIVEQYGYGSEGESISIVDPYEAWILEIVGTGNGGKGGIWVAVKIPDGCISAHANMSRIGEFPLDDPENCLYSPDVVSFAIEKGYYDPASGRPFRFNEAYNPPAPDRLKYCETRVWSIFRRAAPSLNLSPDYHRGVKGAERYPLWIKPDHKLGLQDVIGLARDHYEGTPYDLTRGIDAGPFNNPNRCRPIAWQCDSVQYSWERPISTINSAFSIIAQGRSWLPADVGGILWFGEDDTYVTCYIPVYCGATAIPEPYRTGDLNKFSWQSAFWVFNFASNYINLRYSCMIKDLQQVQKELETTFIVGQDSITAAALGMKGKERAVFLTGCTGAYGMMAFNKWTELGEHLITKYNDGYIKDEKGSPQEAGYPDEWKRIISGSNPGKFRIPRWE
jgi:dipeptidase